MKLRTFIASALSPFSLSNQALIAASIIGGISTFVLVPGLGGYQGHAALWGLLVVVSQSAFALTLVAARTWAHLPTPQHVLIALVTAGTIRGLIIQYGINAIDFASQSANAYLIRAINSSLVSVIGLGLIGASLYWLDDYRRQYQVLAARSIALARSAMSSAPVSDAALSKWQELKTTLDRSLEAAAETLANTPNAQTLRRAAQEILTAVDLHLRPSTKQLWPESKITVAPLRLRALFKVTIADWKFPMGRILLFFAVVVGIGSLVRSGWLYGSAYTARYLALTAALLWLSKVLVFHYPRLSKQIALGTLASMPVALFAGDVFLGRQILQLPADDLAQLIVDIQTPFTVLLFALTADAIDDRQRVLSELRSQVEKATDSQLLEGEMATADLQQLGLFLHHSVQSELVATAMQLHEAGLTSDPQTMEAARSQALSRISQLQMLDEATPPWLRTISSYARIDSIASAWNGIARISIELPAETAVRDDQWLIAAQVIEEGIANAIRHGDATRIDVKGNLDHGRLVLTLTDNGTQGVDSTHASSGLGLHWLESVAPGDWSFVRSAETSQLVVGIE